MLSMIRLLTANSAIGSRAVMTRTITPQSTTAGPDCHTIFSTGGICRIAPRRSSHADQKFSFSLDIESVELLQNNDESGRGGPAAQPHENQRIYSDATLVGNV